MSIGGVVRIIGQVTHFSPRPSFHSGQWNIPRYVGCIACTSDNLRPINSTLQLGLRHGVDSPLSRPQFHHTHVHCTCVLHLLESVEPSLLSYFFDRAQRRLTAMARYFGRARGCFVNIAADANDDTLRTHVGARALLLQYQLHRCSAPILYKWNCRPPVSAGLST